jgi:hypothetical protein
MYQGHLSDGSSIQKHSAGALYPYVIGFRGLALVPELIHPTGEVTQHASYDHACAAALELKTLAPAARVCGISADHLTKLVCGQRTARDESVLGFIRGVATLIKSFGQRTARADLVLQ